MDDKPSSRAEVLAVLRLVLAKELVAEVQMVLKRKKIQAHWIVELGVKKRSIGMMSKVDDPKMVKTQRQKEFNWLHANEELHEVQISECCCLLTSKTTGKL